MQSPSTPRSLRLVVDANILVGELLRQRGRDLLRNPYLDLSMSARAWSEMEYELPGRIRVYLARSGDDTRTIDEMLQFTRDFVVLYIRRVDESVYLEYEAEARARIPDDPDDWPTVALALALDAAIWTEDRHFLGRGLATWRTDALREYLA